MINKDEKTTFTNSELVTLGIIVMETILKLRKYPDEESYANELCRISKKIAEIAKEIQQ